MWVVGALRSQVDVPIWQKRATRVGHGRFAGGPDVPAKADGPPPFHFVGACACVWYGLRRSEMPSIFASANMFPSYALTRLMSSLRCTNPSPEFLIYIFY